MTMLPDLMRDKLSNEKLEKVVNPPQNPVVKRSFQRFWSLKDMAISMPINKEPVRLIPKVAQGNNKFNRPILILIK